MRSKFTAGMILSPEVPRSVRAVGLLASERSERDTIRGNKWKSEIYIWYVQDTLVARARCYVMWEELSVSHF